MQQQQHHQQHQQQQLPAIRRPSLVATRRKSSVAAGSGSPYVLRTQNHQQSQLQNDPSGTGTYAGGSFYGHTHSRSSSVSSVSSSSANSSAAWSDIESRNNSVDYGYASIGHHYPHMHHLPVQQQQQQQQAAYTFPPLQPAAGPNAAFANASYAQTASASVSPVDHPQQDMQDMPYNLDPYLINLADTVKTAAGTTNTTEKAKVAFVHNWLAQSFVQHPEGNVSRQALYGSYIHICGQYGIHPINAASYGKAVRSFWPGIKTRRLGVRGASRYHYCGIRPVNRQVEELVMRYNVIEQPGPNGTAASAGEAGTPDAVFNQISNFGRISLMPPPPIPHPATLMQRSMSQPESMVTLSNQAPRYPSNGMQYRPFSQAPPTANESMLRASPHYTTQGFNQGNTEDDADHEDEDPEEQQQYYLSPQEGMSSLGLRRQASAPSLAATFRNPSHQSGITSPTAEFGEGITSPTAEFSFADMKTPTAMQFLRDSTKAVESSQDDNDEQEEDTHRLAQANAEDLVSDLNNEEAAESTSSADFPEIAVESISPESTILVSTPNDSSMEHIEIPQAGGHQHNRLSSNNSSNGRAGTNSRRGTFPDLQITIPPLPSAEQQPSSSNTNNEGSGTVFNLPRRVSGHSGNTSSNVHPFLPLPPQLCITFPSFESVLANASITTSDSSPVETTDPQSLHDLDKAAAEWIWNQYTTEHCRGLLEIVAQARFDEFEAAMMLFWVSLDSAQQTLVQHPILNEAMYQADSSVFEAILLHLNQSIHSFTPVQQQQNYNTLLRPDTLASLKRLSTRLEQSAVNVLQPFSQQFVGCRVELVSRTAHLISRHLGVVQLAQALANIILNPASVQELLSGWRTIDFEEITNQSALVTNCSQEVVSHFLDEFHKTLSNMSGLGGARSLQVITDFADNALAYGISLLVKQPVSSAASPGKPSLPQEDASREFLLKWHYISSQITRDLTIKSHPAFGSFQIMSLFIEEWLGFKVLKGVALHVKAVSASVAAEESGSRQAAMFADTSAYLLSPTNNMAFDIGVGLSAQHQRKEASNKPPHIFTSGPPPPIFTSGAGDLTVPPSQPSPLGSLPTPGISYNFASILSPTTRALFGDAAKTPVHLNFHNINQQPSTPLALAMQMSPGLRQGHSTTASTSYTFDDFQLPLPSPARLSVTHPYR